MNTGRRKSREYALQVLFSHEFVKEVAPPSLSTYWQCFEWQGECRSYAEKIIETITVDRVKIDQMIRANAFNWKISRIAKVELNIVRIAIAEVHLMKTIDYKVGISEAVRLAIDYSSEEGGRFVNGLLDGIFKTLPLED